MVDLHDSLRPTGTVPPLPLSEIADRGRRRKRRRLVSTTGLAVATMGIAAFAISNVPWSPTDTVTVADGIDADSTTSIDAPTTSSEPPTGGDDEATVPLEDAEQTTSSTAPTDSAPTDSSVTDSAATDSSVTDGDPAEGVPADGSPIDGDPAEPSQEEEATPAAQDPAAESPATDARPATTPGIRTSTTSTSEWEDGYCIQIEVINDNVGQDPWQVVLDLDGTIATLWNATVVEVNSGTFVFSGQVGYNDTIQPGKVTSFGTCVDTNGG